MGAGEGGGLLFLLFKFVVKDRQPRSPSSPAAKEGGGYKELKTSDKITLHQTKSAPLSPLRPRDRAAHMLKRINVDGADELLILSKFEKLRCTKQRALPPPARKSGAYAEMNQSRRRSGEGIFHEEGLAASSRNPWINNGSNLHGLIQRKVSICSDSVFS